MKMNFREYLKEQFVSINTRSLDEFRAHIHSRIAKDPKAFQLLRDDLVDPFICMVFHRMIGAEREEIITASANDEWPMKGESPSTDLLEMQADSPQMGETLRQGLLNAHRNLLDWPMWRGLVLRQVTKTEIEDYLRFRAKGVGTALVEILWLKLVADRLENNQRVGDALSHRELQQLRLKAEKRLKDGVKKADFPQLLAIGR